MANQKISDLAAVTDLDAADEYVLARSGATKKITGANLSSEILSGVVGATPGTELDYAEITSPVSVTATVEASANSVVAVSARSYDGSTRVCIEFFASEVTPGSSTGAWVICTLWDGSTDLGRLAWVRTPAASAMDQAVFARRFLTPSAASHTFAVKAFRVTANGTINAGSGGAGNALPAYMRVTLA